MPTLTDSLQMVSSFIYRFIPRRAPSDEELSKVKIVAHRGAWNLTDRLENTLPAFRECLNHKIWAIEFDVRFTKDDVPIVHHDESTVRVFEKDLVIADMNFEDLRRVVPQIPTFAEVIEELGQKLHFMIELKTQLTESHVSILKDLLKTLKPIEDYHFMSLEIPRFRALHFVDKKALVSIARLNIKDVFDESLREDLGGFTGQYLLLNQSMNQKCKKKGIKVGTGFPDSKNLFFREVNRGVDWVYTNHAPQLAQFLLALFLVCNSALAKEKVCEGKFKELPIKKELQTLEKIESRAKELIIEKPECEKDIIEVARYLRSQYSDLISLKFLSKYDGKKNLDSILEFSSEDLKKYGMEIRSSEGSYYLLDKESYYLKLKSSTNTPSGQAYQALITEYESVVVLDDASLLKPFMDVAKLLLKFESFALKYPEALDKEAESKIKFMRKILAGFLDNSPCVDKKSFKLLKKCGRAIRHIVRSKFESPSRKIFRPIFKKAISKKIEERKEADLLLEMIRKDPH